LDTGVWNMWKSDGTNAGTVMLPLSCNCGAGQLPFYVEDSNTLYFTSEGGTGWQIVKHTL